MGKLPLQSARLKQLKEILRPDPHHSETPEGRSQERYRRVILSLLANLGARSISILTLAISVPLTIGYLGTERYGMWVTLGSIVSFLAFADLGISNGLLNKIAYVHGHNDRESAQQYVSSAFGVLCFVSLILGLVFILVYPQIPWPRVFNVASPIAVQEAGPTAAVVIVSFLLGLPLGVVQRIQQGYQEGYLDSLWTALGKILGLVGVLVVISLRMGLPWLVLALSGAPVVALLLNSLVLFGVQRPWLRPRRQSARWEYGRNLLQVGMLFFTLQLAGVVAYSSDSLVIAHVIGPDAVSEYAVAKQLFGVVPLILSLVLTPLWPAYGEAAARGEHDWIRRTFHRSLVLGLLFNGLAALMLLASGSAIITWWVGDAVTPSTLLVVSLGIWTMMNPINGSIAMLLNGLQIIRFQMICSVLMAVGNIVLSILLTRAIGVSGVVWGSIIAQAVFIMIPSLFLVPKLLAATPARVS